MNIRISPRPLILAMLATSFAAPMTSALAAGEEQAAANATAAALHGNSGAGLTVEQRLREELRVVVMDMIQTGAFGNTQPQQIALNIEAPPQKVSNLGLIVDSASSASGGLRVLAVTPGGGAERMGLRAGDVLLALNGSSLATSDGAATLRQTVDALPDGGRLAFDVRREGKTEALSGASASVYLPAMRLSIGDGTALASNTPASSPGGAASPDYGSSSAQGCGRISDFDVAPRGQQLHAAKIMSIDGVTPGPTGAKAFRVNAGSHVIKVSERIESRYLPFNDRQRNSGLYTADRYKTLTVNVAPDTTYLVAAHLNDDKRNEWRNGAYWDPVVWKENAEGCR